MRKITLFSTDGWCLRHPKMKTKLQTETLPIRPVIVGFYHTYYSFCQKIKDILTIAFANVKKTLIPRFFHTWCDNFCVTKNPKKLFGMKDRMKWSISGSLNLPFQNQKGFPVPHLFQILHHNACNAGRHDHDRLYYNSCRSHVQHPCF